MNKQLIKTIILLLLITPDINADVSGKVIAYTCYSCHGEHLINLNKTLSLSAEKLTLSLLAFKASNKNTSAMHRIAKGFSNAELKAVASYISGSH